MGVAEHPGLLLRQTPANHFTIEEFVRCRRVRWPDVRPPIGITGHKSPVVELNAVAETSARADVAHAGLFLASEETGFIAGVAVPVDGGMTFRMG